MKKETAYFIFVLLVVILSCVFYSVSQLNIFGGLKTNRIIFQSIKPATHLPVATVASPDFEQVFTVVKVVDGDTIEVSNQGKNFKLRYIGIDTPETVDPRKPVQCFGKEASEENKKLVLGKQVFLKKDVSDTDKYGRLLRYVYVKLDDGGLLFVNDYLVRLGFAHALTYPPDVANSDRFLEAEREARSKNLGLWQKCPVKN